MGGIARLTIAEPSARQILFLEDKRRHIAYGGARGGGKSWAVRTKAVLMALRFAGIKILILRKTYKELANNHIEQMRMTIPQEIAKYNGTEKAFGFFNGSKIYFGYCACDADVGQYQGAEYDVIFIDEATQLQEDWIRKINLAVRGANRLPKRTYYTCNPGGASHGYIKRLFIDRTYQGAEIAENYSFIPAKVRDNHALMQLQPEYLGELESLPPKLRAAWLDGDWNIFEGQFFEDFVPDPPEKIVSEMGVPAETLREQHRFCHVIKPFDISTGQARSWHIMRSYDFGYNKPFSLGYWAIDYDGTLYRILEYYGCTESPNTGVKMTPDEQFAAIAELERTHPWLKGRKIVDSVADPSIWDASRGESVAETAARYGIYFTPGDNQRIPGWMQMHYRLQFDKNGYSRMYIFENCKAFIRTIPLMMYSDTKPEDLDTDLEDHCITGDTLVHTAEGRVPISELVGTQGKVWSSDGQLHEYEDVRMTRKGADVYTVTFEDGSTLTGTADHRVMLEDGTWCELIDLLGKDVKTIGRGKHER